MPPVTTQSNYQEVGFITETHKEGRNTVIVPEEYETPETKCARTHLRNLEGS